MKGWSRLFRRPSGDEGAGLILIIGTAGIVMVLVSVTVAIAQRSLNSGRTHNSFAVSLAAAETGIDQVVARVQNAYDTGGADTYTIPRAGSADCASNVVDFPSSAGASSEAEKSWARAQLEQLATVPGCLTKVANAEYVTLKPTGRQVIYAMGWSPSYAHADARSRVIKTEYIFAPYKPTNAVLTGGDLELSASTTVTSATTAGGDQASVHSNGDITVGGGNPTVTGSVTQSGDGALPQSNKFAQGGKGTRTAPQSLPQIEAANIYRLQVVVPENVGRWFDLCPDGIAREADTVAPIVPCTGAILGDYSNGSAKFRNGWWFAGDINGIPTWEVKGEFLDGIYFIDEGNVRMGTGVGNRSVASATIIASSVRAADGTTDTCAKVGGNIDWNLVDLGAPALKGTFMVADQDLRTGSNFKAGSASGSTVVSGFFLAGDQVELQTSSSGAYGSVIAGDDCSPAGSMVTSNFIKNPTIYFDPTGYAPFTDVINTTLWLELVG